MELGRKWRATAWAVALVWALVPALSAIHGAVENHVYCAEHGAFEHAEAGHSSPDASASITDSGTGETDGDSAHDLCSFSEVLLRDAVATDSAIAVLSSHQQVGEKLAPATVTAPRQLELLALAPKSSPPV